MGRRDRMEVAGEVQIDPRGRDQLALPRSGTAALHPEHRSQRRLAEREARRLAEPRETLRESDAGGGLAFARGGRRDRGDQHQSRRAVAPPRSVEQCRVELGDVVAVGSPLARANPERVRDFRDRPRGGCGQVDLRRHRRLRYRDRVRGGRCRAHSAQRPAARPTTR